MSFEVRSLQKVKRKTIEKLFSFSITNNINGSSTCSGLDPVSFNNNKKRKIFSMSQFIFHIEISTIDFCLLSKAKSASDFNILQFDSICFRFSLSFSIFFKANRRKILFYA